MVGVGIILKFGVLIGGFDIIVLILFWVKDWLIGIYMFILNVIIIVLVGFLYGVEKLFYMFVMFYIIICVIDVIYMCYVKFIVMIVIKKGVELRKVIYVKFVWGIMVVLVKGGFINEDKEMLMIVLIRYELYDLEWVIKEVDFKVFINIV